MARKSTLKIALGVMLLLFALWPSRVDAEERYFMVVFGSQSTPKTPDLTHTWATFVKTTLLDGSGIVVAMEEHTISWLPATLKVRTLAFHPEPGRNFDLDTTIRAIAATGQRISYWGPFEIDQGNFNRFLMQKAWLESGKVRYKAIDTVYGGKNRAIADCIHAVSDTDESHSRFYYSELRYGEEASEFFVYSLAQRKLINPALTHDWIAASIGLPHYPVARRSFLPR